MKLFIFIPLYLLMTTLSAQVLLPENERKSSFNLDKIPEYIFLDLSDFTYEEGNVEIIKDRRLDFLVEQYNKNKTVDGYRVQLFSGRSREEAMKVSMDFREKYPNVNAHLNYQQPNFKVRVGDFASRLEASRFFESIKSSYPSSFIIKDRINIGPVDADL